MTLLVVLSGRDGMVLACDSRGTFGDPRGATAQNDTMRKLFPASKFAGIMLSGIAPLGSQLMEEVSQKIKMEKIEGATKVMEAAREPFRRRYDEWFPNFLPQSVQGVAAPIRPALHALVAGYDVDNNGVPSGQRIYSAVSELNFAPMLHDYGFCVEGVGQYALYLLNRLYEPKSKVSELSALAAYVIAETASQDGKVGGPVQMMTITASDGQTLLSRKKIVKLIEQNEQRASLLKYTFFNKARPRKRGA
jgi:20S proteasome alpha/beta subunit